MINKAKIKRAYVKPEAKRIFIDNSVSLWMMSESSMPSPPPWCSNQHAHYENPFKIEKV